MIAVPQRQHGLCPCSPVHCEVPCAWWMDCSSQLHAAATQNPYVVRRAWSIIISSKTLPVPAPPHSVTACCEGRDGCHTPQSTLALVVDRSCRPLARPTQCPHAHGVTIGPTSRQTTCAAAAALFATLCWASCIRPEDAFGFPCSPKWFTAVILSTNEMIRAMRRD